jgi:hypothetical protein
MQRALAIVLPMACPGGMAPVGAGARFAGRLGQGRRHD